MQILAIMLEVAVKRREINPSSINSEDRNPQNESLEIAQRTNT
jgi:hypothetical protein